MAVPVEPVVFMKATSSICGPDDTVVIPRGSKKTDWEVELGVVIGKPAKYVKESDALSHVAGYCVINDLSERAFQLEGTGQWVKGKERRHFRSNRTVAVTPDEVPDPQNLEMWLEVDGRRYQNGSTRTMVFGIAHQISYLSRFMSLRTGDIISSTGTPPGVGSRSEAAGVSARRQSYSAWYSRSRPAKPGSCRRLADFLIHNDCRSALLLDFHSQPLLH